MRLFVESATPYLAIGIIWMLYFEVIYGIWEAFSYRKQVAKARQAFEVMLLQLKRELPRSGMEMRQFTTARLSRPGGSR